MIIVSKRVVIELERRAIVRVCAERGTRVDCLRGRLWITEWRSCEDIVLGPGDGRAITHRGVAVVQALDDASAALHAPARRGLASRLQPLWQAVAGAVRLGTPSPAAS